MRVKTESNFYSSNTNPILSGSNSVKASSKIQGLKDNLSPISSQSKITMSGKSPRMNISKAQSNNMYYFLQNK